MAYSYIVGSDVEMYGIIFRYIVKSVLLEMLTILLNYQTKSFSVFSVTAKYDIILSPQLTAQDIFSVHPQQIEFDS